MVRNMSEKKSNFALMDEMEKEDTYVDHEALNAGYGSRIGGRWARTFNRAFDDENMGVPVILIAGLAIMGITDLIDSESWLIDAGAVIAIGGLVEYLIRFVYRWNKHHERKG